MPKIIGVTGRSTGLGASIAVLAARAGHVVDATMRDTGKSAALSQAAADEVAQVVIDYTESANPPIRIRTPPWANGLCELKTNADPDGRKLQRKVIDMFLGG